MVELAPAATSLFNCRPPRGRHSGRDNGGGVVVVAVKKKEQGTPDVL